MLINCDAKGLEWVAGTFLSRDEVAIEEILAGKDQHSDNQENFKLPSRLIAKKFVFRLIYGGTEYSYANDADFMHVSTSQAYWKAVIEAFYNKYRGWAEWHKNLMGEAISSGEVRMPTGRVYSFRQYDNGFGPEWPRTQILNYPVQGLGADLMAIARVSFLRRLKRKRITAKLRQSVHDSIVVDTPSENLYTICTLFNEVFRDIPANFKRMFGVEFYLPLQCEIQYGSNLMDMKEWNANS